GIVYPAASRKGTEVYMLELRVVPARDTVIPGTLVVTSGLGGVFPRGVAIGTVIQAITTSEVWTHTYLVKPSVNPWQVTSVFILTAQRATEGTGNVWSAGTANVDATLKRIAGAGDSLAKQAAVIEAAARRASLDSLKRATIDSVRKSLGVPETTPAAAGAVPGAPPTTPTRPAPTTVRPATPTTDTAALRIRRD